jgi:hypothetical protein
MDGTQLNLRRQEIAELAYELWERNGRPAGSAESDWLKAEQILELENPARLPFGAFALEAKEE